MIILKTGNHRLLLKLVKLEFSLVCGDGSKVWCARVKQFFNYQVTPNSQKVPLNSFHLEAETQEWWQWLKYAYKEKDKEHQEKFFNFNIKNKVPLKRRAKMGDNEDVQR